MWCYRLSNKLLWFCDAMRVKGYGSGINMGNLDKQFASDATGMGDSGKPAILQWIAWPALYLGLRVAAPFVRIPYPALGNILATVLFLTLPLLWLRWISEHRVRPIVGVCGFLLLAIVWGEMLLGLPLGLLRHVDWRHHHSALRMLLLVARPVADLALITAAALVGSLLARIISDPKMLLPVALVGAVVDYWGVYMGTTAAFIKTSPELVRAASAGIPSFGGGLTPHGVQPASFVGFGDWLFLTMFLAVAFRFNLQPKLTFWMLLAFLAPAMLIVIFGGLDYLPAIVPMALAIFAVNGRRLKLSRSETFASLYALLMVAGLIGGYSVIGRIMSHVGGKTNGLTQGHPSPSASHPPSPR
jgi:hypothetical protein